MSSAKRHRHEFTSLWFHLGTLGRPDVHVHQCFEPDCFRVQDAMWREAR